MGACIEAVAMSTIKNSPKSDRLRGTIWSSEKKLFGVGGKIRVAVLSRALEHRVAALLRHLAILWPISSPTLSLHRPTPFLRLRRTREYS